jgi:hypothetical protein
MLAPAFGEVDAFWNDVAGSRAVVEISVSRGFGL